VRYFPALIKLLLSSICLCACFAWTVYAEENTTSEQLIETTTQQPLVDTNPEPGHEPETTEKPTTEEQTADVAVEENTTPAEQAIIQTPQPPLIDAQPQPAYEPEIKDETPDKENQLPVKQAVEVTPQPPLIDPQPQPGYGPEDDASSLEKKDITPVSKTAEEATLAPVVDQTVEPVNGMDTSDSTSEFPLDTENKQDEVLTEEVEVKAEEKQQAKKWTETYPVSVNADWLQLKSGEWLRGRITILQKDSLEFDSDELDDLVIKWKNVKYLKSYEPYSLRFDSHGRTPVIGVIEVIGNKVHVKTDYDDQTFDRSDLLTIASGKETEISYWKNKITFSINIRKGNTDQTDFASKITAKRRTTDSRLILDYLGNFTQVEDTETINNHRINQTYDVFLTRDLFWSPIFSEYYRDPFKNIDQQIHVGIGIGYSIINTNESEWNITAGPAYQETKYVSVLPGVDQVDSTLTMSLGTNFETELNSRVDLEGLYNVTLGDEETGNYSHHSLLTIETEITDKLDFDVTAVWDRVRSPVADQDGNTPQQDDFGILIGLGYDL